MDTHKTVISASSLAALLGGPGLCVVDCRSDLKDPARGRREFLEGHIKGAVFADLDSDLAATVRADSGRHPLPDPDAFRQAMRRIGLDDNSQVVAYDGGNGGLAARLWWMLRWLGHERVAVLDGGIAHWQEQRLPMSEGDENVPEGGFSGEPRDNLTVSTDWLAEVVANDEHLQLVDARDAARFRGEVEPIDAVAGHVPGALNRPFTANLDARGLWKQADELRSDWLAIDGLDTSKPWAVMCGSGVTACHLALSAEVAGLPAPALYVGSWSEWIRDSRRPIGRA